MLVPFIKGRSHMLHDLLHRDIDLPFDIVRVNWQETYQEPALLCGSPERCVFTHPAKTHEGTGLVDLSFISKKLYAYSVLSIRWWFNAKLLA